MRYPAGGISPADFAKHPFQQGGIRAGMREIDSLQHHTDCFGFLAMAGDTVFRYQRLRLCGGRLRRRRLRLRSKGKNPQTNRNGNQACGQTYSFVGRAQTLHLILIQFYGISGGCGADHCGGDWL